MPQAGSTSAAQAQPQGSPTPPEAPEEDQPGPDAPLLPLPTPSTGTPPALEPITELPSDIGKPISEAEVRRHLAELSGRDSADTSGTDAPGTSAPGADSPGTGDDAGSNTPAAPDATPAPVNSGPTVTPTKGVEEQQTGERQGVESPQQGSEETQPTASPAATAAGAVTVVATTSGSPGESQAPGTARPAVSTKPSDSTGPSGSPGEAPDTAPAGPAAQVPAGLPSTPAAQAAGETVTTEETVAANEAHERLPAASSLSQPPLAADVPEQPRSPATAPATRPEAPRLRRYQPPTGDAALEDTAVRRRALLSLDPQPGEDTPSSAAPHLPTSRDAADPQPPVQGSQSATRSSLPASQPAPLPADPDSAPAGSSAAAPSAGAPDTTSPNTTAADVPPTPLPATASAGTPDSAASAPSASSRRSRPRGSHRRETPREKTRAARRTGSRAASHWAGVLVAVALLPLAWFLVHDGAVHMTGGDASVWPDSVSVRGATELVCGAAAFVVALFMAHRSSLGTYVVGGLGLFFGLPFLVAPAAVASLVGPTVERLQAHSSLGEALTSYVMADGLTGRFVLMGLFMVMVGVVSDSARRAGRRERTAPGEPDRETGD